MAFDEALVQRDDDGRFGFKQGQSPEVSLDTTDDPPLFSAALRERLAENELEYRIQRAGSVHRDELREAYQGARSHQERCDRYSQLADAYEAKSRRIFSSRSKREQSQQAADTARDLASICEAHVSANAAGNIRVSTARSAAKELTAAEAHKLHAELHRALHDGDPDGRIGAEYRAGGGRRFQMVYPDGTEAHIGQDDAETLYARLHTAYSRA